MNGLDKAREVAEKLKAETEAKELESKEIAKQAEKELVTMHGVTVDADVAAFYKSHAGVGSENLDRTNLPMLKVTESNSNNTLANGQRSSVGKFFYTGDNSEHDELEVSLMSVSRGFYSPDLQKRPKFTQLVCGMMLDTMQPFIMYVAGKRLSNLWDFGKKISPLTKDPSAPMPMMCMKVKLSTQKVKNSVGGDTHIINFNLVTDGSTFITDRSVLDLLDNGLSSMNQAVESIIESQEVDKNGQQMRKEVEIIKETDVSQVEEVSSSNPLPWEENTKPEDDDNPL